MNRCLDSRGSLPSAAAPHRPAASPANAAPPLPDFLQNEPANWQRPLFVARERELARLHAFLDAACRGQGQVALVTGEAGAGKSSLLAEFLRQALDRHPDLLAADGACTALGGLGDPYLPFRQALAMLTGDLAGRLASGLLSRAQAVRLWEALPETLGRVGRAGVGAAGATPLAGGAAGAGGGGVAG